MGEQTKNMLVGFFILAACALTVSLILFLKPSVGDMKKTYYIRFANINKIGIGTQVMFAGKPVGEVVAINRIYDSRKQPSDSLGDLYCYQLTIKVDSSVSIYNTDEVSLQTSGLLGEKSIAIIPKAPGPGITPRLITDQPIYAQSVDPIENAFTQLSHLATEMKSTFSYVNGWLDRHGESIADAICSFKNTMDQITITMTDVNKSNLIQDLKTGIQNFSQTMEKINHAIDELEQGQVFTNISVIMKNIKSASASIDIVANDLATGRGTLGKLIKNDDIYLKFTAILSKVDTLMNDVNHYGILFHLNKSWQRQRLQRVNLMNSLDTPTAFREYFEKEIDDVNMAMSRLSMLIEKAEQSPERQNILNNEQFTDDFADLLKEVDALYDNLRLYNEQLFEAQKKTGT